MPLELDGKWIHELSRLVDDFDEEARAKGAFGILGDRAHASVDARRRGERRPDAQNVVVRINRDGDRRPLRVASDDLASAVDGGRLAVLDRSFHEGGQFVFARNPDAVEVAAHPQRPLNSGLRFSRNAVNPSFASSDAKAR